jgi:hypothetical protein
MTQSSALRPGRVSATRRMIFHARRGWRFDARHMKRIVQKQNACIS